MGVEADRLATRTRPRARTEGLRNPPTIPVPPPPMLKSGSRERSSSFGATFVSTAVVPAPDSTEILSNLISSLTVLTDSTRNKLQQDQEPEPTITDFPSEFLQHESFVISDSEPEHSPPPQFLLDPSDDEVAEAPVIGYARGPVKPAKKSVRERWNAHRAARNTSVTSLNERNSNQTFRAPGAFTGIGVPSIERPPSSAAMSTSASVSRPSLDQSIRTPLKMLFPSKSTDDQTGGHSRATSVKDDDTRSTTTTRSMHSARRSKGAMRSVITPDLPPMPAPVLENVSPAEKRLPGTPNSKIYNPLDPANREDLNERLIPSRRSSQKNSPSKSSARPTSSKTTGSHRGTKPTITEDDILEEEDPTWRRIKELQRAREKRQTDWEKENEKPEKAKQRPLTSDAKLVNGVTAGKPALPKNVENARKLPDGDVPSMSATINGNDLGMLPAFNNDEASPAASPSTPTTPTIQIPKTSPVTNGRNHGPPPSPLKHRRRFSGSLRRSSSLRRNGPTDAKSVIEEVEAHLSAPRLSQKIRHPRTGRTITFSEVGDPNGFTVFVCAGMGITRYITVYYDEVARIQKLRLINLDRPGTGDSDALPDNINPVMAWADDVMVICQSLNIQRFSLMAHSAGSVYALATALKMPQYLQGKIHLLAPWIPPSQMVGAGGVEAKGAVLPKSHKLLSVLPTSFLKAANSRFLAPGIEGKTKSKKDKNLAIAYDAMLSNMTTDLSKPLPTPESTPGRMSALSQRDTATPLQVLSPPHSPSKLSNNLSRPSISGVRNRMVSPAPPEQLSPQARQALYNRTLTDRIWALANLNGNPATDIIVCFERKRPIGYFYTDVTRSIVIHHGRLDERIPLSNIEWLSQVMPRCELRILDNEDHSLMSSAIVMNNILTEISREWEEWDVANRDKERRKRELEREDALKERERRERFIKTGRY